ncbi:MAG: hypothetical protein MOB07_16985 [Acidobacteria bacterium]|nr:hypothetical protein [Acidobacteriota bacterium]MCI0661608.1 hypothetical protein [Acidobacteriota bacterium]
MSNIFYQANFCAECGNLLEPRQNWRPRYFCDDCAARMKRRGYITPLSLLAGLLILVFMLNDRQHSNSLERASMLTAPAAVSARDATPRQIPLPLPETPERVLCGARTKKGTPCRRLVRPGQRCSQHRGLPSLIELKQGREKTKQTK